MPPNLQIGYFIFSAVLFLLAITGGNFEIFGSKFGGLISNKIVRLLCFCFGLIMFLLAIQLNPFLYLARPHMEMLENVDYHASGGSIELSSPYSENYEDCAEKCLKNSECRGYTFSNYQKKCFLKSHLGDQKATSGMVSGIKYPKL